MAQSPQTINWLTNQPIPFINDPGPWTAYTPTVASQTGTLTTASAAGRFVQLGKTVCVNITITITTNGTGASWLNVSLPVTVNQTTMIFGRDTGVTGKMTSGTCAGTNTAVEFYDGSYPGSDGAVIVMSGAYEST